MITPIELPPPPQPATPKDGNEWQHWFFQLQQALGALAQLDVVNKFKAITTLDLEGVRFAGEAYSGGNTIQAAINAAGTTGAVIIPPGYTGTDDYNNENNLSVLDLRNVGQQLGIWSVLSTSWPVNSPVLGKFPLGNDLTLRSKGPADLYLETLKAATTTATTMPIGTTTITVGTVNVGTASRGNLITGTTSLFALDAGLQIGRDLATAEVVPSGSWSILSSTTLSVTCAIAHPAGTTDVEQLGIPVLAARGIIINSKDVRPAQNAAGNDSPFIIFDANLNIIGYIPTDTGDTWPLGGFRLNAFLSGANGANSDLLLRQATTASNIIVYAANGSTILLTFNNSGNMEIVGSMTVNSAGAMIRTNTSWTNGAGASAGTLTNAPGVGDPTKWIPVFDNGTTRYIPAW